MKNLQILRFAEILRFAQDDNDGDVVWRQVVILNGAESPDPSLR